MKKLLILLALMAMLLPIFADTVSIGTGTSTSAIFPISGGWGYNYTQQIYTQTQINTRGDITKIRFYYVSGAIANSKDWIIYMGHTDKAAFNSNTDWVAYGDLTEVFNGDVTNFVPAANNWMEITLDTPFSYNNIDNLVIAVDENTPSYVAMSWGAFNSDTNTGIYYRNDTTNPDPSNPPTAGGRANAINRIQLVFPNSSAPLAPTLTEPANGGWALTDAVLKWQSTPGVSDANAYDVYFGTDNNPPLVSADQTASFYTPTLAAGQTYYWKVVARNEIGDSPASAIYSFKTPGPNNLVESFEPTTFPPAGWANPGAWSRSTTYKVHGAASAYKYGTNSILSMPRLTISNDSSLNFWSYVGTATGTLQVVYSDDRVTWTQVGANITHAAASTWYNNSVDLSSLAGNSYYLGLRTGLVSTSYYVDMIIGPEITPEAPGAPALSLPAANATNQSITPTITWTAPTVGGVPTGYNVYVDTVNPPTTLVYTGNTLNHTLSTALDYSTDYYWTVEAINATGTSSQPTPRKFTTREDPVKPLPYSQDFNGGTVIANIEWISNMSIMANHGTNGSNGLAKNIWSSTSSANATTPPIGRLTDDCQIMFDYRYVNYTGYPANATTLSANDKLEVQASFNDGAYNTIYTIDQSNHITNNAFASVSIPLRGHANDIVQIKFLATWGAGDYYLDIDNVVVRETPNDPVFNLSLDAWDFQRTIINTEKTKEFTITNSGGGTLDISSISISGDHFSLVNNPAPIGLTAGLNTSFTVKYAPTGTGNHTATVSITHGRAVETIDLSGECYDPTIYTFPWEEKFDSVVAPALPLNWIASEGAAGASQHWKTATTDTYGASSPYSAPNFAHINCYNAPTNYNPYYLITPPLSLDATAKRLSYRYWIGANTYAEPLFVDVSTDMENWTTLYTHSNATNTNSWQHNTLSLESYTDSTIYLRFRAMSNYGSTKPNMAIDDVLIEDMPAVLEPSALTIANVAGTSADLGWTENNTPAATQWDIIYGAPGFDPASEGTLKSGLSLNPYRLTDLSATTTYSWYVRSVTSGNEVSAWAGPGSFTTTQVLATLPFSEGFESWPSGWTVLNGTQVNQWHVGDASYYTGAQSAYISNDGGATNYYSITSASTVHLYRDITFTADSKRFNLEFWWKGNGEGSTTFYDYLRVFLVDPSVTPVAGTLLSSGQIGSTYNLQNDWTKANIELPGTLSGTTKRLVFTWRNDSSTGTQAPIAIDDILLTATPIPTTPVFTIDPTAYDFGSIQIGTTKQKVFTILNDGAGALEIARDAISISGDNASEFALSEITQDISLSSGEQAQITISFAPITEGDKEAILSITDNTGLRRAAHSISLIGKGKDSVIRRFPFTEGFEAGYTQGVTIAGPWTQLTGPEYTSKYWTANNTLTDYNRTPRNGNWNAFLQWGGESALLRPIALEAGIDYKLEFYARQDGTTASNAKIKANLGTEPTLAALTQVIVAETGLVSGNYQKLEGTFSVSTAGVYYLAIQGWINYTPYYISIDDITIDVAYDYPENTPITVGEGENQITITMEQGNANNVPGGVIPPVNNAAFVQANGFVLALMGTGPWTIKIETTAPWGAFYRAGSWTALESNGTEIVFNIPAAKGAKAGEEIAIVLGDKDPTLPITLSAFTAVLTADMHVKIAWIAESETDHAGYNLLRSEVDKLATAIRINGELINQGEINGSQISYQYTDSEVYPANTYFYWLESQSLNGAVDYYGPLQVQILAHENEEDLPVIPLQTKLYSAFPNPFNPSTNLRYSMKEAGEATIQVFNVKGQLLKTFHNRHDAPGYYQVNWDGRDAHGKALSTGVYFYRMSSGKYSATKKMVLSK